MGVKYESAISYQKVGRIQNTKEVDKVDYWTAIKMWGKRQGFFIELIWIKR